MALNCQNSHFAQRLAWMHSKALLHPGSLQWGESISTVPEDSVEAASQINAEGAFAVIENPLRMSLISLVSYF